MSSSGASGLPGMAGAERLWAPPSPPCTPPSPHPIMHRGGAGASLGEPCPNLESPATSLKGGPPLHRGAPQAVNL